MARDLGVTMHIVGRPGTGKTSALWHIAQEFNGTYVEIDGAHKKIKGMLELLLQSKRLWDREQHTTQLADAVQRAFQPRHTIVEGAGWEYVPQLLIVDEVQTLEATAVRELVRIQERCQLALVIAGNEERLAGTNKEIDTLEQNERRIAARCVLPGPSKRDCELIGASFNVEGKDAYAFVVEYGLATNFGDLNYLLTFAERLTGGVVGIRLNHLLDAHRLIGKNLKFNKELGRRKGAA
ncbi:ATP-binding protein [Brucella endophytica]|nr:ATP-binding protein [Brucella endophytica]